LLYVEGICMSILANPMVHAWNAKGLENTVAIDWTFYATSKRQPLREGLLQCESREAPHRDARTAKKES
jgi:hypothetical protein